MDLDPSPTPLRVLSRAVLYLSINCAQPLLVDVMRYHGAAAWSSFVYIIPTYLAMVFLGLLSRGKSVREESWASWRMAMRLSVADLSHQILEKIGLVMSGSAVYMVCSSTGIAWTAILSSFILKKRCSPLQWGGIICVCSGLALRASMVSLAFSDCELLGVLLITGASVLHGLSYVWNERALSNPQSEVDGTNLVCMMGIISSGVLMCWTVFWTLPRYDVLIAQPILLRNGSLATALLCWFLLLFCAFVRSITLWYLLKHVGAVGSGVLKGARTGIVLILSHLCFCARDAHQCLDPVKAVSGIVCVVGVLIYSLAPKPQQSLKTTDQKQALTGLTLDPPTQKQDTLNRALKNDNRKTHPDCHTNSPQQSRTQ